MTRTIPINAMASTDAARLERCSRLIGGALRLLDNALQAGDACDTDDLEIARAYLAEAYQASLTYTGAGCRQMSEARASAPGRASAKR